MGVANQSGDSHVPDLSIVPLDWSALNASQLGVEQGGVVDLATLQGGLNSGKNLNLTDQRR